MTADLTKVLRRQLADAVVIEPVGEDRVTVSTPFMYSDGDHCGFAVYRDERGLWRVSDEGEVFSRAGYAGVDLLAAGRAERFRRTADFYGVSEESGELSMPVEHDDFGRTFYLFSQACLDINRLARLSPERKQSGHAEFKLRDRRERTAFLDQALGLHQRLEILYVVDGYEAEFYTQDGNLLVAEAKGETILEALDALAVALRAEQIPS